MAARQRALEKKAINNAEKEAREQAKADAALAKEWEVGSKNNSKQKAKEEAEMAKLKKKQEMADLLAEDAAAAASGGAGKVTKKKGADKDLEMFKAALNSQPKSKAEKEKERKEKEKELRKKKEDEAKELKEAKLAAEAAHRKRAEDRGIVIDHGDDMMTPINNRSINDLDAADDDVFVADVRGIDEALGVFSFGDGAGSPVPGTNNRKAAYAKFSADNLPRMKEELPGLKLSQYQERMSDLWRKSSDNPDNRYRYLGTEHCSGVQLILNFKKRSVTSFGISEAHHILNSSRQQNNSNIYLECEFHAIMQVTLPRQAVVRQVSPHQVTIQRTRTGVVDTVAGIVQEVKRDMQKKEHQKTRLQQRLLENKVELENCQRESRDQEEVTGRLTAALSRNTSKLAALKLEIQAYGTRADEFEVEPYNFYCSLVTEIKAQLSTYEGEIEIIRRLVVNDLKPQVEAVRTALGQAHTDSRDMDQLLQSLESERRNLLTVETDLAAQLAVQQCDRDCLLAELQARAEQLQQMDQALAGLENDITVAEKQVGACSAQLEALAQSAQEQLEDCVRRTAETKQSVAEMQHNNERLVQETATQREEWGQASLALSDALNGLENTLGQLEVSWAEEERRTKHFTDVQQPAEEAARALLASICAQEENLVWRAKHHAAESELEALRQEQLSMVAVTAARENNRRMEEALAAFTEADKRAQRALTALPPCPVTTTNESTHELIARARDRLEALAEHRDVIATGGATLDRCLEAMVPQAAAIAALTTQLENSVAETTAVEAAIAQLESAQKGVFTAQEEEHIEEATAAKLQPQLADSERLNRQEIADLEAQIKETTEGSCQAKLAAMQQLHDDELDHLRAQILQVETQVQAKAGQQQSCHRAPAAELISKRNSHHDPAQFDAPGSAHAGKVRVQSAISRSLESTTSTASGSHAIRCSNSHASVFDFDDDVDFTVEVDATRVEPYMRDSNSIFSSTTGGGGEKPMIDRSHLMDVSSLNESLPAVSSNKRGGNKGPKCTNTEGHASAPLRHLKLDALGSISPIGSTHSNASGGSGGGSCSSADEFLLGFSSSRREFKFSQAPKSVRVQRSAGAATGSAGQSLPIQTSMKTTTASKAKPDPGAPAKAPKGGGRGTISTGIGNTVHFGALVAASKGYNRSPLAKPHTQNQTPKLPKAKTTVHAKRAVVASPGDWFFDDQSTLF